MAEKKRGLGAKGLGNQRPHQYRSTGSENSKIEMKR